MRRVRLALLPVGLFLVSASAFAQTFVQATAGAAAGAASSFALPFPSNTKAGDLILIGFDFGSNAAFSSIMDSQGNVFTEVGIQLTSPGGSNSRLYYANNIKGGADTVTINLSSSSYLEVYLTEYSGVNQAAPIDAQAGATGPAGAVSSGNATTTAAGDLIYGFCAADFSCSAASGFNARSTLNNNLIEDTIAASPGAYAAAASANNGWTMQMVALKAGSSSTPLNACDLATPYGSIDASDVQAAINMSLGLSPCIANIAGSNVCNVVVVQRVIDAALPGGTCITGTGTISHSVSLNWAASTTPNVTYNVYRSNTSGSYSTPLATLIGGTTYTDNNVASGQTYYYVVTAVNGGVESVHSNESPAVIPTP
jgi:hypothetical protein